MTRSQYLKDLKIQEQHEGLTDNIRILRRYLELISTGSQWSSFVGVVWQKYGVLSYEAHRFHYADPLLVKLMSGEINALEVAK